MAKAKERIPIIETIGDRLREVLKHYTRISQDNLIYDAAGKTLNPAKLMPSKDLRRYLESISAGSAGSDVFSKFFDLSVDRISRYSEYEQIINRIPEAARALQLYVDSILSPNLGSLDNQLIYTILGEEEQGKEAKTILSAILDRTRFEDVLSSIIYTTLLYGDCFLEIDSTSNGVKYIIHNPKTCTILRDEITDIELGVIVQTTNKESKLMDMLSYSYPDIKVNLRQQQVAIISNAVYESKNNTAEFKSIETQIMDLLKDIVITQGAKYKYLTPNKYIRFSIFYNNNYYPYGTSVLDAARGIGKQLLLVEAALAVYRATRTPLRTLWKLEVANTPDDQIPALMQGVMNRLRRQKVLHIDGDGGIDTIPDMMAIEEDIFTPTINGQALLSREDIPPADLTPYTEDADYFKKKLLSALGIPPSYLAEESGGATRALLTLEDINFSRTIKKYQNDINHGLEDLSNICFILIEQPQYLRTLKLVLPVPKTIEDNMRVENLNNRLSSADSLISAYPNIPKMWILKNVVGFTDDDIQDMEACAREQTKYMIFDDQNDLFIKENENTPSVDTNTDDDLDSDYTPPGFNSSLTDSLSEDLDDINSGEVAEDADFGDVDF